MLRTQPRHLVAVVVTAAGVALTGCAASEPEPGAQTEASAMSATAEPTPDLLEAGPAEPYTGPYDADFANLLGLLLSPLAWVIGVPWQDATVVAA